MAAFGLSDGASWGSEGSRARRKRPYLSPSPLEEEEAEEEAGGGGWGGSWGSRDRDERERPRLGPGEEEEEEEEEEEGRRGRSRRPRWDPPRGSGRSRSPPSRRTSARRSLGRSRGSPGAPSRAPAWRSPDPRRAAPSSSSSSSSSGGGGGSSCSPAREGGRSRWREGGSRAEAPKGSPWEPVPRKTPRWKSPGREEEGGHQQQQHPGLGRRMMGSSHSQRSSSSSSYKTKGGAGWEARQDQDHRRRERETYPKKGARSEGGRRGSDQREGSYGGRERGWDSPSRSRSKGGAGWELKQDQDQRRRETYPREGARSVERQRGPEPTEGGFRSYARGEGGWSSPSRGERQGGPSWGNPKWKDGREDSPSYRVQSHFDSDLRGSKWDSPELKRREYERPTSGKGLELRPRSSEDLQDWGSSTDYLEEWSLKEGQAGRKSLHGGSSGPEGRPKIYMGSDKRAVAPRMWVPREEVVNFWNRCQSLMQMNVRRYLLSTCPRPTLPDKSCETPILNPSIKALLTTSQVKDYTVSSYYLRLIHEEVLNMLGPVMTIYEMAEESIEKREAVDPLELREWARRIVRYIGSLNQRLQLQHCSQILGTINPRLKRMTSKLSGRNADGLLFAEDKVKLLKEIIRSFPELENERRDTNARNYGDQNRGGEKFASHPRDGAAQLREFISAPESYAAEAEREKDASLELWHRRFAHQDAKAILELQKRNLGVGIEVNGSDADDTEGCAVCFKVKGPRPSSPPRMERRSTKVLDLIHSLLHGPLHVPSLGNNIYVLIFVDDFSRYCFVSLLKEEKEMHERLATYVDMVEKKFQRKPTAFEMDNGPKSFSHHSQAFLEEQGILHGTAAREQSGSAAREMRSLLEMTTCMLADAELSDRFWADAIMTAAYLLNRLPVEGTAEIPFELWNDRAPSLEHIRVFGSLAYAYIPKVERHPLDPKREETIFLGYTSRLKCYKAMNLTTGEVCTRTVDYFDEERKAEKSGTVLEASEEQDADAEPVSPLAGKF